PGTAAKQSDNAALQAAARTSAEASTAAADRPTNSSGPKDAAAHDKTRDHSKKTDTTGPIAALIQAPLIATQTVKPGRGSQGTVGDATSGRSSSAAASLHASWQQLFARLDSHGAANGQTGQQPGSQTGGDSPAQLLAALTMNDKAGAHATGDADGGPRFATLHAEASNAPQGANGAAMAGITGHGLHSATSPQSGSANAGAASTSTTLSAPIASDDWNHALGQQTLRLAGAGGQKQAQIQLHPRELGQINISVTVNDHNQAQIHFAAAHAHVREAVEAALPQLRQSLAAGGLSLGQASVGDQNSQAAFSGNDDQPNRRGGQPAGDIVPVAETALDAGSLSPVSSRSGPIGGIDIFA
ncbi:MAG: flagellar hook-length control protein FliK, partial [Salinisphaera sp.]|uniref:flagellar hook-length control protein FliK n=1 Tax=Salinisphaera sp. TaxID=1914330 RepID=UPI003C7AF9F3